MRTRTSDVIVIFTRERHPASGRTMLAASHGIEVDTGKTIVVSQDSPEQLGAVFDPEIWEYIIRG